jgi:riboflavin transporter FmnP
MPKKQKTQIKLTLNSFVPIISLLLSIVFIWSVARLAQAERGVNYRGAPKNFAAIVSFVLLVYSVIKCKNKWEQILIGCVATALVCGYIVYLVGLA